MLASEIAALFPKEWELARQKYNRDLGDLTRLFTGQPLTRRPAAQPPSRPAALTHRVCSGLQTRCVILRHVTLREQCLQTR